MLTEWLLLTEELLEEARRRIGVRRWRIIKRSKFLKVRRKGKGSKIHKAKKLHRAIRKGPVHNRHR